MPKSMHSLIGDLWRSKKIVKKYAEIVVMIAKPIALKNVNMQKAVGSRIAKSYAMDHAINAEKIVKNPV